LTPLKLDEEDLNPMVDPISSEIFDLDEEKVLSVDVMTKDQIITKTQSRLAKIKKKEQLKECIMTG
jgi:hypothetical protein